MVGWSCGISQGDSLGRCSLALQARATRVGSLLCSAPPKRTSTGASQCAIANTASGADCWRGTFSELELREPSWWHQRFMTSVRSMLISEP